MYDSVARCTKKYKNIYFASYETEVQSDYEFDDIVEPPEGAKNAIVVTLAHSSDCN